VIGLHPAVAQIQPALVAVRQIDEKFRRQGEGGREVDESPVEELFGAVLLDALSAAHVGDVGIQLPPLRGLEREVG